MSTYIKDIFNLPDRVHRGDFVLVLSEGIQKPEETINNYVITKQLANCFDSALDVIKNGVLSNKSKGCYLHGSFGSGKSHFMAILSLILKGNTDARSISELASVISKHNSWTKGKNFLIIPFHMIGKESIEQAILGGYVDYIEKIHPDSSIPGIFRSDELFKNAVEFRNELGDEKFFAKLNTGISNDDSDWKILDQEQVWTSESFENALNSSMQSDAKNSLAGDLVKTFFSSVKYTNEFVDLDLGLSIISKHTKSLGYDALILFLDELILWLATRAADVQFINREGPKLAKLVETQISERPIPIISFVARQRDLKELIGDNVTGAEYVSFSDVLDWWEARFATIKLEDKNLPEIAKKRILQPKSEHAKKMIDQSFEETSKIREEVMNVLLTSEADKNMFRSIYPFSPAFMNTLIAMSFLLQRERTALKVMLQVLIDQKDYIKLGDIIPVGDLYDAVSEGDEAVCDEVRRNFDNAIKLYEEKLKPMLESEYNISFEDVLKLNYDDPKYKHIKNDDRIIKTLLLASLAPNVESLKGLTTQKLAALNHGTIKSPIPGRESTIVLSKCRKWASQVGQIKIGDSSNNPSISIQLTGLDIESIIDQAKSFDSKGNRIREVKKILFEKFGVKKESDLLNDYKFQWRGTDRICDIMLGNVRELPLSSFETKGDKWQIIIDWPFDDKNHGPKDDCARLEQFRENNYNDSLTIVILPSFLSSKALNELGKLVIITNMLKGDNFKAYTNYLTPSDKQTAKSLLENQQSQLKQLIIRYLENAYGISSSDNDAIDQQHKLELSDQFCSLHPGFDLKPPVGADLKQALYNIFDQMLSFQFPAHPIFEDDIKITPKTISKIFQTIESATQKHDGRIGVDKKIRKDFRKIVSPLKIGQIGEAHFLLEHYWKSHFNKCQTNYNNDELTVENLRNWIDEPVSMGLPKILQNLIIFTYAAQSNLSFYRLNKPVKPDIDKLEDDIVLKTIDLPSENDWNMAIEKSYDIFGINQNKLLNAVNLSKFSNKIVELLNKYQNDCLNLPEEISGLSKNCNNLPDTFPRLNTANASKKLINDLIKLKDKKLIEKLAKWNSHEIDDSAIGTSIKNSYNMISAIKNFRWELIKSVEELKNNDTNAQPLLNRLETAVTSNEYVISLKNELNEIEKNAIDLINKAIKIKQPFKPNQKKKDNTKKILEQGEKDLSKNEFDSSFNDIRSLLKKHEHARVKLSWEIYKQG